MKIYAGNLHATTTEADLKKAFAKHGAVLSVNIALDHETGKPKNFGFIEMKDDAQGLAAITALHGSKLCGNTIKVNESKPRPEMSAPNPGAAKVTSHG